MSNSVLLMLNLCLWIGNICNGLLLGNASIARGLTCCKKLARHEASRKSWSTKFPLGGGGKPYLATGLLYTSFHVLTNVYSCLPGADNSRGHILMSTETSCRFGYLLPVSKNLSKSDFVHVYSPKAGADQPMRMKFLCQQEYLVTLVICCNFQKRLFEV